MYIMYIAHVRCVVYIMLFYNAVCYIHMCYALYVHMIYSEHMLLRGI